MNMSNTQTILNQITDSLKREALTVKDPGLLYGRTGIALYFFQYARSTSDDSYEDLAMQLIESVLEEINLYTSSDYASGLAGIGTGIAYLIQNGFIGANPNEVLQEIDSKICTTIHLRQLPDAGLEKGVCGIGHYLTYRIQTMKGKHEDIIILKNKEHLIYLIDWIEEILSNSKEFLNDILDLMIEIRKTDIYVTKVEKIMTYCMNTLQGDYRIGIKHGKTGTALSLLNTRTLW